MRLHCCILDTQSRHESSSCAPLVSLRFKLLQYFGQYLIIICLQHHIFAILHEFDSLQCNILSCAYHSYYKNLNNTHFSTTHIIGAYVWSIHLWFVLKSHELGKALLLYCYLCAEYLDVWRLGSLIRMIGDYPCVLLPTTKWVSLVHTPSLTVGFEENEGYEGAYVAT